MKKQIILFFLAVFTFSCASSDYKETEILVVGGGASGVSAAIQAARLGADVVIIEKTEWLGGMLTSAGVSAIDGNHKMPSGIWGEFRQKLYDHYGGPEAVFTGWVSNTQFEPHIGNRFLTEMVEAYPNIKVIRGYNLHNAYKTKNKLNKASFINDSGNIMTYKASVFIDGTEYGDLLAKAGAEYSIQMETSAQTGEESAPDEAHPYVQDLTYVAILKDYGEDADMTIPKPDGYNPTPFDCMCRQVCSTGDESLIECDNMLDYGKLPNDKYMINWPNKGNDFYAEILKKDYETREQILQDAKNFTLSWVYFMQTEGGYKNLGLADDEFPTEDQLALIPYIRESRRVVGVDRLFLYDILNPYEIEERPVYKTGIAVGDYPVDHHRKKNPVPKQIEFPKIPSYNVPYGSLIPKDIDGLIVAEKSISVSNVTNGTTRLQPVVLQLGQAAGAAAAHSVKAGIEPRNVDVRELQQTLLDANMWLMPYMDVTPDDWAFQSVQKVGLSGIMKGEGIPVAWANETRFHPDRTVSKEEFKEILDRLGVYSEVTFPNQVLGSNVTDVLGSAVGNVDFQSNEFSPLWDEGNFDPDKLITRKELAFLIDKTLSPFEKNPVTIGFPNPKLSN